ncbi:hypothetical protein AsAng_0038760 [Aureispira anguillae]|uniref:Uncharacterized protein n=1 Tax=Aureispira anguillae TaxID=2864201 RepID=A0A915YHG3_9BACT|nr:hypothetical protein AsAng_0038760 [Aureispira anguillae]
MLGEYNFEKVNHIENKVILFTCVMIWFLVIFVLGGCFEI